MKKPARGGLGVVAMDPDDLREAMKSFEEVFLRPLIEELADAIIESESSTKH